MPNYEIEHPLQTFLDVIHHRLTSTHGEYTTPRFEYTKVSLETRHPGIIQINVLYPKRIQLVDAGFNIPVERFSDGTVVGMGFIPVFVGDSDFNQPEADNTGFVTRFTIDLHSLPILDEMDQEQMHSFVRKQAALFVNGLNTTTWLKVGSYLHSEPKTLYSRLP